MKDVTIITDGTLEGTTLKVDGKDVTKDEYVVDISMHSSASFKSKYSDMNMGGYSNVTYTTVDGEGTMNQYSLGNTDMSYDKVIGEEDSVIRHVGQEVDNEIKDLVDKIVEKANKGGIDIDRSKLMKRSKTSLIDKLYDMGG